MSSTRDDYDNKDDNDDYYRSQINNCSDENNNRNDIIETLVNMMTDNIRRTHNSTLHTIKFIYFFD